MSINALSVYALTRWRLGNQSVAISMAADMKGFLIAPLDRRLVRHLLASLSGCRGYRRRDDVCSLPRQHIAAV